MSDVEIAQKTVCEGCGGPVRVHVLEGYRAGRPVIRCWCMQCADHAIPEASDSARPLSPERLSVASMLILGGLGLGFVRLFAGRMGGDSADQSGAPVLVAGLGVLLVLIAALLRADPVGVLGTIIFFGAACAELISLLDTNGAGLVQDLALFLSAGLIIGGLGLRRRAP